MSTNPLQQISDMLLALQTAEVQNNSTSKNDRQRAKKRGKQPSNSRAFEHTTSDFKVTSKFRHKRKSDQTSGIKKPQYRLRGSTQRTEKKRRKNISNLNQTSDSSDEEAAKKPKRRKCYKKNSPNLQENELNNRMKDLVEEKRAVSADHAYPHNW